MKKIKVTEWSFVLMVFGLSADKKKLPVRLLSITTVLFLILAGSPLADMNVNAVNPASNPYAFDKTPPASKINLQNITYAQTYINWTWTDPTNSDFSRVMVYFNGAFQKDVTKGVKYYRSYNDRSCTDISATHATLQSLMVATSMKRYIFCPL